MFDSIIISQKEEERRILFQRNQEEQEIKELERQMKIAEKIKEKELQKKEEVKEVEPTPIELSSHQPISFSLGLNMNKSATKNPLIVPQSLKKPDNFPTVINIPVPIDDSVNGKRKGVI